MMVIVHLHTATVASVHEVPSLWSRAFGVTGHEYGVTKQQGQWVSDSGAPLSFPVLRELAREEHHRAQLLAEFR